MCIRDRSKTLRAGIKNSGSEKLFGTSIQPAVDTYYTVDMVFNKGTVKLYWNGQLIKGDDGTELKSGYSIMAVSYTHLDVYKRQDTLQTIRMITEQNDKLSRMVKALDVYKRQV